VLELLLFHLGLELLKLFLPLLFFLLFFFFDFLNVDFHRLTQVVRKFNFICFFVFQVVQKKITLNVLVQALS
jgi:ABC-type Zn uptake system ZnuABC Zn-binding protein ZnuA